MNKELLAKLNTKKYTEGGNSSQVTRKEYGDIIQACRDGIRKSKLQLELKMESLASDIKVKKIDFFKYIGDKRMAEINMGRLLNETGNTGCGKG